MAKTRRQSTENIFSKKGSVQPLKKAASKKAVVPEEVSEITEDVVLNKPEIEEVTEKEVAPEKIEDTEKSIPVEEPVETSVENKVTKTESEPAKPANINKLFAKKKERGKQHTIYFRKDVYDFIEDISKEYELGMSEVVNRLLETFLED